MPWYDVFGAVEKVSELLTPVISKAIEERYDKEHSRTIQQWEREFAKWQDDNPDNDSDAGEFIMQLLTKANHPAGSIQGRTVRIPLDVINSLIIVCSENIKNEKIISQMRFKK